MWEARHPRETQQALLLECSKKEEIWCELKQTGRQWEDHAGCYIRLYKVMLRGFQPYPRTSGKPLKTTEQEE